jgi:heme exporter protein A
VSWRGSPIAAQREDYHRELVWCGHAASLKDDLSALENLRSAAMLAGDRIDASAARHALAEAGLRGREHLPARSLSAGQRRRVVLARLVLASSRPLWVLDEPFNTLDANAAQWLTALLQRQLAAAGIVVLTSHQPIALDHDRAEQALTIAL